MYARSVMLVRRDVMRLERDGVETVQMQHDAENDTSGLVWKATLAGPAGSVWEGAAFQLRLCFPANYDAEPPQVAFTTIPFHPNIDPQTGRPCIDFLDTPGRWQPGTDLQAVLYTLQTLLAEPALEQPVFPEAAAMLTDDPERFRAIARECVLATQRVQAGLPPYDDIDPNPNPFSQAEASSRTKVHTIPEQQQQRPTASAKQVWRWDTRQALFAHLLSSLLPRLS